MNLSLRFLLLLSLVVGLTSCQIFSRGKKKEDNNKSDKTEVSSIPSVKDDNPATSTTLPKSMTRLEQNMLDEINNLRTYPQGYIVYVKEYMAGVRNNSGLTVAFKQQELTAAQELISELSRMPPLPSLKAHMGLFQVAVAHGQDLRSQSSLNHIGSDGSYPWDRVRKQTDLSDGNENLVGGGRTVREAVLILLVDSGVSGRGHRINLLDPQWEYVACHNLGKIGTIENCWIQLFGGKAKTVGQARPVDETNPSATDLAKVTAESDIPQPYDQPNRDIIPAAIRQPITTAPAPKTEQPSPNQPETTVSSDDFSFMSQEEREMIREINLMRSNPRGYIPYVRRYLEEFKQAGWDAATVNDEVDTGKELIGELEQLKPLSILKPHKDLHRVAVGHGMDLQQMGKVQHVGSDGSHPWERVRAGTSLTDGNENLVGGLNTVRESVINLLIDAGIPGRGHRKTLLEPKWEYAACYKVGNIGEMPNCWVQVFGKQ